MRAWDYASHSFAGRRRNTCIPFCLHSIPYQTNFRPAVAECAYVIAFCKFLRPQLFNGSTIAVVCYLDRFASINSMSVRSESYLYVRWRARYFVYEASCNRRLVNREVSARERKPRYFLVVCLFCVNDAYLVRRAHRPRKRNCRAQREGLDIHPLRVIAVGPRPDSPAVASLQCSTAWGYNFDSGSTGWI